MTLRFFQTIEILFWDLLLPALTKLRWLQDRSVLWSGISQSCVAPAPAAPVSEGGSCLFLWQIAIWSAAGLVLGLILGMAGVSLG